MLGLEKIATLGAWAGFRVASDSSKNTGRRRDAKPRVSESECPVRLRDLDDLHLALGEPEVLRLRNRPIRGLADHSANVRDGYVFFAVPGLEQDGGRFAKEAEGAGAVAVVAARPLPVQIPVFLVPDVRRAASRAAHLFHGRPSRHLQVVGVTGTNGKSTVTDLLSLCLEDDARPVGSLGTIGYRIGQERNGPVRNTPKGSKPAQVAPSSSEPALEEPSPGDDNTVLCGRTTTPGAIDVQFYLRRMLENGVRAAVIEVSSHALDQGRIESVTFDAAVFTNLSQDHLDYHGTMGAYARAKARLFRSLEPGALAVLPADDPSAELIFEALPNDVRLVTYSLAPSAAGNGGSAQSRKRATEGAFHVWGEVLRSDLRGSRLRVYTPEGSAPIDLPLVGRHNVRNALAAMACAVGMGVGTLRAADALNRARPVRGRLERVCRTRATFPIFVDYAHTPDALRQVLTCLAPLTRGQLRVLFGCGGERDRVKRPVMGRIAKKLADHVVLTDDNPRRESSERILDQILEGVNAATGESALVEVCANRRQAIRHILGSAKVGDIVVIAGKGHEQGQTVGDKVLPFDDLDEVEGWLCSS